MTAAALQKTNRDLLETTLGKIARILSDRYDINVYFHGDQCCTQGRDIFLPSIPEDCPEDLLHAIEGFLDHEAAHIIFTDFNAMAAIKDEFQSLWFNIVEDARVEQRILEIWRGCGVNLENAEQWAMDQTVEEWDNLHDFVKMTKAALLYAKGRTDILDELPESAKLYKDIEPLVPALKLATTVPDSLHAISLSEWICKKLGHTPEEPRELTPEERERLQEATSELMAELAEFMEAQGTMPGGEAEGTPATGKMTGEKEEGEEEEQESSEGAEPEEEEIPEVSETIRPEIKEESGIDPEEAKEHIEEAKEITSSLGKMISSGVSQYRHYETDSTSDTYIPFTTAHDKIQIVENGDKAAFAETLREVKRSSGVLMRKLKAALLSRYNARMEYDKTWGKLNTKALPRLLVSGYPKVFKRRVVSETLNCRFSLLIDQSGSMRGMKNKEARRAAILFGEFADKMGIPFEILGFTSTSFSEEENRYYNATPEEKKSYTRWGSLEINIYKQFHEDWRKVGHRLMNLKPRCHNYDGEAVLFAAKRLLQAKETTSERSILFVFSDGLPEQTVSMYQPHHQRYLKKISKQVQKQGVECFGIGILTESVKKYYKNWVTIEDPTQLQGAQIDKLKEALQLQKKKKKKKEISA